MVANGDFTIRGATIPTIKDWLGQVYVAAYSSSSSPSANHGDVTWSGTASVTSRDYTQQLSALPADRLPKPMWLGRYFSRDGTYNDEYGNIWVPGNSTTSVVFDTDGSQKSYVLCPLLCTTERTQVSGNIDFGTRAQPMVYFFMCDNNGIYPQVVDWSNKGTFFGLMVINESTIDFHGQSNNRIPSVEGAVFAGCPYTRPTPRGCQGATSSWRTRARSPTTQAVLDAISTRRSGPPRWSPRRSPAPGSSCRGTEDERGSAPPRKILTPLSASGTGKREDPRGPGSVARTARGPVSFSTTPSLRVDDSPVFSCAPVLNSRPQDADRDHVEQCGHWHPAH